MEGVEVEFFNFAPEMEKYIKRCEENGWDLDAGEKAIPAMLNMVAKAVEVAAATPLDKLLNNPELATASGLGRQFMKDLVQDYNIIYNNRWSDGREVSKRDMELYKLVNPDLLMRTTNMPTTNKWGQ